MVTPKTGNPRGRRKKLLRTDSDRYAADRYAIAFAMALQGFGLSEASALDLAASVFFGKETVPGPTRRRQPPNTMKIGWIPHQKPGAVPTESAKSRLKKKMKRLCSDEKDIQHMMALTNACMVALGQKNKEIAAVLIEHVLAPFGELDFARKVLLLPIPDLKNNQPDLIPRVRKA